MSNHNVQIEVVGAVQAVPVADAPASIIVTLAGQPNVTLPAAGPYLANFTVADGTYAGTVQAARTDGSLIGSVIAFTAVAPANTVQGFVPASVNVTVTAAP